YFGADRIAIAAQLVHIGLELRNHRRAWRKKRIVGDFIPGFERDGDIAELGHATAYGDAVTLTQPLARDRARRHRGRGQAGGRPAAATRITYAVLVPIGVIRVTGPEGIGNIAVILAAGI